MGKIYTVEIGFSNERHCLYCPLRDREDDSCNMKEIDGENLQYNSWEDQMMGCPLRFNRSVE